MSDGNERDGDAAVTEAVAEVQGTFPNDDTLQEALAQLDEAGYDRSDVSLPEEQPGMVGNTPDGMSSNPTDDVDTAQLRTLGTGMAGYAGAVAVAGAILATGGAAALAVGGAAAVGLGSGVAANATGHAAERATIDERNRRGAAGTLVLAVRATTPAQAHQVIGIMRQAGATQATPVNKGDNILTAGVSSASWTGS